ncbi:ABC-2 family transporter protein [Cohnella sp. LGH]|uniref:ABC transporter permease n=1 Tax=Cohnella sp. LGH TaxID=1619153 RepID=UPI001ADAA401|nr:ABC-2 family transporter protein [Cohnella sp. LGH]QTH41190.1 ABC-2 family transporter protein [Cohnella sp. LGH]
MLISSIFTSALGLIFLNLLFNKIPHINGWTHEQIIFVYGMVVFTEGIASFFFEGVWLLPYQINSGSFDKYLLKPISPVIQVLSSKMGTNGIGNILLGMSMILYSITNTNVEWGFLKIIGSIIIIFSACFIPVAINLAANSLTFWFTNAGIALPVSINSIHEFGKYPITIYHNILQFGLLILIPYAFVGFIPASFIFDIDQWSSLWILCPVISIYCVIASLFIFKRGIKKYESTGN